MTGRSPVFRAFSWLAGGQLVRLGLAFGVSLLLIRSLGPETYGLYAYVLALSGLFASLPRLGIHQILLRDLARSDATVAVDLGTGFALKQLGGLAALLLASAAAWATSPDEPLVRLGVAIVAAGYLFQGLEVVEIRVLAEHRAGLVTGVRTAVVVGVSAVKVALIALDAPVLHFFVAVALDAVLLAVGFALLAGRTGLPLRAWRFSAARARALLSEGWPMLGSALALLVQARVDQVMIGDLLGRESLGQYSAALRLLEATAFLPVALQTAWAPSLARAKVEGPERYRAALRDLYRVMIGPSLAVILVLVWLGDGLVGLLFGADYAEAGALVGFFSLRLFFTSQGLARTLFVTNEGLLRFAMSTATVGALVNVGLNLWWIPRFGLHGAIAATLISFAVSAIFLDVLHPRARLHVRVMLEALLPAPRRRR